MTIRGNEICLNKFSFCWRCGRDFNREVLLERKTYHHAIAQLFKPKFNVKIPVCQECHYDINPTNEKMMVSFLKKMRKTIDKFLEKYNYENRPEPIKVSDELKKLIKETKNV